MTSSAPACTAPALTRLLAMNGGVSGLLDQLVNREDIELLLTLQDSRECLRSFGLEAAPRSIVKAAAAAPEQHRTGAVPTSADDHAHAATAPQAADNADNAPKQREHRQRLVVLSKRGLPTGEMSEADHWVASLSRRQVQVQLQVLTNMVEEHQAIVVALQQENVLLQARARLLELVSQTRLDQMTRLACPMPQHLLPGAVAALLANSAASGEANPFTAWGGFDAYDSLPDLDALMLLYKAAVEEVSLAVVNIAATGPALVARIDAIMDGIKPVYEQLFVRQTNVLLALGTLCMEGGGCGVPAPEDEHWQLVCRSLFLSPPQVLAFAQLHEMYCAWSTAIVGRRNELMRRLGTCLDGAPSASMDSDQDPPQLVDALHSNIIQERCLLSLVAEVVSYKVLHPQQLALLMVVSFPFACDALTLLHAMAHHGAGESAPPAPKAPKPRRGRIPLTAPEGSTRPCAPPPFSSALPVRHPSLPANSPPSRPSARRSGCGPGARAVAPTLALATHNSGDDTTFAMRPLAQLSAADGRPGDAAAALHHGSSNTTTTTTTATSSCPKAHPAPRPSPTHVSDGAAAAAVGWPVLGHHPALGSIKLSSLVAVLSSRPAWGPGAA